MSSALRVVLSLIPAFSLAAVPAMPSLRLVVMVSTALAGCDASVPALGPPPVVVTPAPSPNPPAPTPSASEPTDTFLDPEAKSPVARLRAKVALHGAFAHKDATAALPRQPSIYASFGGDEPSQGDAAVLDASEGSPRIRVLCEDSKTRIAVWVARSDLLTVTTKPAVMTARATATPDKPVDPTKAPGVSLDAGEIVTVKPSVDGAVRVYYSGHHVVADGILPAADVGTFYTPAERGGVRPLAKADGQVVGDATFFDAPRDGERLARVHTTFDGEVIHVEKLAQQTNGHLLLRVISDGATLVGWAKTTDVSLYKKPSDREPSEYALIGVVKDTDTVKIARGTRLEDPSDGRAIGVVTSDFETTCVGACKGVAEPLVVLWACGANIQLRVGKK